jgi:hypothetical protein
LAQASVGAAVAVTTGQPAQLQQSTGDTKFSRPISFPRSYQAAAVATAWAFLSFPQVTPGKIWEVKRFAVWAMPDPSVVLAGVSVIAYIDSQVPQDGSNAPGIGDMIASAQQVPNTSSPLIRSTILRENERLILAMKGLANNQVIGAVLAILEHDKAVYMSGMAL